MDDHRLFAHSTAETEAAHRRYENGFEYLAHVCREVSGCIEKHTHLIPGNDPPSILDVDTRDYGVFGECWSVDIIAHVEQPESYVEAASLLVSQLECLLAAAKGVEAELREQA